MFQADASDTAVATFWEGKRLYDVGQYAAALTRFESAYAVTKDPVLLYDIAQCQRQIGECHAAKRTYRDFREQATESALAERAATWVSELEQSCPDPPSPGMARGSLLPAAAGAKAQVELTIGSDLRGRPQNSPMDRHLTGQHPWQLSLAILAAGVATGATAAGVAIWNYKRHQTWESRDAELEKGPAVSESDVEWSVRQHQNDELGNSIESTRRVTLALGGVSGAIMIASVVSYFAFSGSQPRATAARLNNRVMPSITPGSYQVLVSGSF